MTDRDLRKNAEGYSDPTAYEAMKNLDRMTSGFTNCYIPSLICVNWPASIWRSESFYGTSRQERFGGRTYGNM